MFKSVLLYLIITLHFKVRGLILQNTTVMLAEIITWF